jgi:hypothetical protein
MPGVTLVAAQRPLDNREVMMDERTFESLWERMAHLDTLLSEVECAVIWREVMARLPAVGATAATRQAAREVIERHYRLWRNREKTPGMWPWKVLPADAPPEMPFQLHDHRGWRYA